jgi:hypothetical protein
VVVLRAAHIPPHDRIPEQTAIALKAIFGWYELSDGRCRYKIFGDIFGLAFGVGARENFPAHDAEQAFLSGIEHAGSRVPGGRRIANHGGKPYSVGRRKQPRRHDVRARCAFGNCDDNRLAHPRRLLTQRHAAHPRINGQFLLVDGEERQVHPLERAIPDGFRRQVYTSDAHDRLGVGGRADDVGGGDDEALSQIDAIAGPRLRWVLQDVD